MLGNDWADRQNDNMLQKKYSTGLLIPKLRAMMVGNATVGRKGVTMQIEEIVKQMFLPDDLCGLSMRLRRDG